MPRTETLFLDAGGVLVNPNWERVATHLGAHGVPVDPASLEAADPLARRELDTPENLRASSDGRKRWVFMELVLVHAGVPLSERTASALREVRDYHDRVNLWETIPEEVPGALRRMRGLGLRLAVVSNANGTVRALFDRVGLRPLVDLVLDSWEEKVEKPDPRFFELALGRMDARPDTTVHVGDLYEADVRGARAAGIEPVLLDRAGLYKDVDCRRVDSLHALADWLEERSSGRNG
ncbi:MAG TPA: HAD family hydrolase [Vicinamibacteria bacterium]|jgi:HAD superfamily hydrolase (TIGR01549 family)